MDTIELVPFDLEGSRIALLQKAPTLLARIRLCDQDVVTEAYRQSLASGETWKYRQLVQAFEGSGLQGSFPVGFKEWFEEWAKRWAKGVAEKKGPGKMCPALPSSIGTGPIVVKRVSESASLPKGMVPGRNLLLCGAQFSSPGASRSASGRLDEKRDAILRGMAFPSYTREEALKRLGSGETSWIGLLEPVRTLLYRDGMKKQELAAHLPGAHPEAVIYRLMRIAATLPKDLMKPPLPYSSACDLAASVELGLMPIEEACRHLKRFYALVAHTTKGIYTPAPKEAGTLIKAVIRHLDMPIEGIAFDKSLRQCLLEEYGTPRSIMAGAEKKILADIQSLPPTSEWYAVVPSMVTLCFRYQWVPAGLKRLLDESGLMQGKHAPSNERGCLVPKLLRIGCFFAEEDLRSPLTLETAHRAARWGRSYEFVQDVLRVFYDEVASTRDQSGHLFEKIARRLGRA